MYKRILSSSKIVSALVKSVRLPVRQRFNLVAILLAALSCGAISVLSFDREPVQAQALVPHALQINFGNLQEQGLALARDAAQLAQFEQYDLALPRARLAVQLAPQSYQTQAVLGSLYLRKEDYSKAIVALAAAHNLKKDNPAVLFSLGAAYLRKGDYQSAIKSIKQGISIDPNEPTAIFDLGNAYFLSKRFDDAIGEFKRVVKLEKKFWAATNNIGLVEYERGNVDLAIKYWEESVKVASDADDQAAEPKLALAVALYHKGDRVGGIKMGEAALKIDPRYGKLDFLKENLWGEKLLADTRNVLKESSIRQLIGESKIPVKPNRRRSRPRP